MKGIRAGLGDRRSTLPRNPAARHAAELFFEDLTGGGSAGEAAEDVANSVESFEDMFGLVEAVPPAPPRRATRPTRWREEIPAAPAPVIEDVEAAPIEDVEAAPIEDAPMEVLGSDHVRIVLVNDDGTPAAGQTFRATFRDGHVTNGTLGADGTATIADHTHGDVTVTFPGLPAASWQVSSFGGS
jgi:hypothetical protein